MKLVTFSTPTPHGDVQRIGALHGDNVIDLNYGLVALLEEQGETERAQAVADVFIPTDMQQFLKGGQLSMNRAKDALHYVQARCDGATAISTSKNQCMVFALSDVALLAPVTQPTSIRDTISFETHAKNFEKRTGKPIPELWYQQPLYYKGNTHTVQGNNAVVPWPLYTQKLDYELEFGIYIGKTGTNIPVEKAKEYIAGYTIFNDISARDVLQQEVTMLLGPAKGKDMDGGNIMGPCMVTPDELDPGNLSMVAKINGEVWSQGNTSDMYWSFEQIIAHVSQSETLHPGDFIGSGTIAFGCGDELERWIQPGDVIELEVEGIGVLRTVVGERD